MAGWSLHRADTVCSACHSSELNSVKHGGILLEYGIDFDKIIAQKKKILNYGQIGVFLKFLNDKFYLENLKFGLQEQTVPPNVIPTKK